MGVGSSVSAGDRLLSSLGEDSEFVHSQQPVQCSLKDYSRKIGKESVDRTALCVSVYGPSRKSPIVPNTGVGLYM